MAKVLVSIIQLLLSVVLLEACSGLQGVLVPIRAQLEGFQTLTIGLFGSAYYFGFISGCLLVPGIIKRIGHIRAFSVFATVITAALLWLPLRVGDLSWALMRVLIGFGFVALYIIVESWLNSQVTNLNRGRIFGTYMLVTWLALVAGKLMFGLWDSSSNVPFIVAAMLACLAIVPVAFTTMDEPQRVPHTSVAFRQVIRNCPIGAFGCLCIGVANGAFWTLGPLYPKAFDLSTAEIGVFVAVVIIGSALTQWPLGMLSDHMDRRKVIAATSLAAALAGLFMTTNLATGSGTTLLVAACLFGCTALPLYGLLIAHANDSAPGDAFVGVSSTLLLIFGIGAVAGPPAIAAVIDEFGISGLFIITASIHLLLCLYTLISIRFQSPSPEQDPPFVAVRKMAAAALNPRASHESMEEAD